ncbi:MAG: nucleotide exchange factor GrpE [Candidatus Sacchiramonaceae bacterium]|nr:nucleotide exchange factor GrpE [Candidatus Saccharimonadaceae bacterium]
MEKDDKKLQAKKAEIKQKLAECDDLKLDLQRTRADFENYRKNTENRISSAQKLGEKKAVLQLLPLVDDIERAIAHLPEELRGNQWAENVVKMHKNLDKNLSKIGVEKINAQAGAAFDPEFHEAVQFDESSDGDQEVVAEELRAGYEMNGDVLRVSMVKVARK